MKEIPLTQGKVALVNDEDYEWLNQWKWCADNFKNNKWYAERREIRALGGKIIFMHRLIMGQPRGMEIDHQDGNGLNNQRENLRICTHAQNLRNRGATKYNKLGIKGVYQTRHNSFYSTIKINHKTISLGTFKTIEETKKAREAMEEKLYGEYKFKEK